MKTNIFINISPPIPYLEIFWVSSYGPKCCQPIKLMNVNHDVYFWHTDKHRSLLQVDTYHFGCVARHAQSTQNIKFAISLQYLKKEVSDEIDFLHAVKHESLLHIDNTILMGMVKHFHSYQNCKFAIPLQSQKRS